MSIKQYVDEVDVDIDGYLRENIIYAQAQSGAVDTTQLQRLVIATYHVLRAEAISYGLLVQRFRHPVPEGYFSLVIHRLASSHPYVDRAARALQLDADNLQNQAASPALRRLTEWLAWVGLYTGAGEAALAIRVDYGVWGQLTGALADSLRRLDVPQEVIAFLDFERAVPPEIAEGAGRVIEYGLAQGENASHVTRSALEVISAEDCAWKYIREG
jgi:hypothetical protein